MLLRRTTGRAAVTRMSALSVGYSRSRRGRRRAACAIAWVESGEVTSTKRITSTALVMISALPVATRGQQHEDDGGPGDQPGGVELVEDVGHPQQAVEADRREQEAERQQDGADDVEDHQNGPPRVT